LLEVGGIEGFFPPCYLEKQRGTIRWRLDAAIASVPLGTEVRSGGTTPPCAKWAILAAPLRGIFETLAHPIHSLWKNEWYKWYTRRWKIGKLGIGRLRLGAALPNPQNERGTNGG